MFSGEDTPIYLENILTLEVVCNFDLKYYPFDRQECDATILLTETSSTFVILTPREIVYHGSKKLTEYEVTDLYNTSIIKGKC